MMLKPGDTFGDYRVLKLLGKGGMGSVFLLENAEGGWIAAKILDPETAGDHESRKRFVREAQLALGVKHPNLIETYDVGEDPETGLCYILMEYVSGGSLADRIDRGPLPIDESVRIVRQIASVLEIARQKGIVHRDIKPANIMFGADGTAKLADLGIARGGPSGTETTVTQAGVMIGTPAYMAPEQMLDAHHVDIRADIYSLGIVFYEMLTGERPNSEDSVIQLLAKAMKGEPLPDVRTLRPEVSASLAQLLSMMVAPDRDSRIATPEQIARAIVVIQRGGTFKGTVVANAAARLKKTKRPFAWKSLIPVAILVGVAAVFVSVALLKGPPRPEGARLSPNPAAGQSVPKPVVKAAAQSVARSVAAEESVAKTVPVAEMSTKDQIVIGCDVSSHGELDFYASCDRPDNVLQFGRDVRVVPLQFKLTRKVLGKVNLLVLSPGLFYGFDDREQDAIREFAESGGVVLALVECTSSRPGESSGATVRMLKQHGVTVYNAPGESKVDVRLANALAAYGTVGAQPCLTYASCSADWTPLALASNDSQKVVCAIRQVGTGFFIFAPVSYACARALNRTGGGVKFPWDRVLTSRLKPVRRPDASFDGSTLDDAPYEVRSSRLRFVSSVVPVEGLRWLANMDDAAVEFLTRRFGAGVFDRNPVQNCIVGFVDNWMPPAWQKRLEALDAVELKSFSDRPEKGGLMGWALTEFFERSIFPRRDVRSSAAIISVTRYMACAAYDELKRKGYSLKADFGASDSVRFARMRDPDFVLYDRQGNPVTGRAPEFKYLDKRKYIDGRFFAMLEDLHKRCPDLFVRYLEACRNQTAPARTYDSVLANLCAAYGSDWPRRWPAAEDETSEKKSAKKLRGN